MSIFNPSGTLAITQATIAAGNTIVRVGPTMLCSVLVTSAATAGSAVNFTDSSTGTGGTVIGIIPIGAAGVTVFNMPAVNGISIPQQAGLTTGNFTISFI